MFRKFVFKKNNRSEDTLEGSSPLPAATNQAPVVTTTTATTTTNTYRPASREPHAQGTLLPHAPISIGRDCSVTPYRLTARRIACAWTHGTSDEGDSGGRGGRRNKSNCRYVWQVAARATLRERENSGFELAPARPGHPTG